MARLRIALAVLVVGVITAVGTAGASNRPPLLTSTPKARPGARVVVKGLFFEEHQRATLYLETGTKRTALGSANVPAGGQFTLRLRLPRSAPKNAHLLACQNGCAWRVRLAFAT